MAFVRQRRDADDAWFSDLDRTRRQQAFIGSLVSGLRRSKALSSPSGLRTLLDVAKQYVAVDAGFDLDDFVRNATAFPNRPVVLYTLPVIDFEEISDGEDVNIIDVTTIRSVVHNLVAAGSPAATASTSSNGAAAQAADGEQATLGSIALNVVNASGKQGEAAYLVKSLATGPFIEGAISTADSTRQTSTIAYGPGAKAAAAQLADELDITANASNSVAPNTVRLTVGTDAASFDYLNQSASPTTTATTPLTTVSATGTGTQEPSPTNLTRMTADGIPCVK
jgi:hypothetical protein